mmetsp:Transcript_65229/g.72865  ORF Transcript_65229/g.72865 Transcript_65229/m.72865 type:complete len:91 (+) Transcript_65229:70-342(+)
MLHPHRLIPIIEQVDQRCQLIFVPFVEFWSTLQLKQFLFFFVSIIACEASSLVAATAAAAAAISFSTCSVPRYKLNMTEIKAALIAFPAR